jgi:hypothetical protein
MKSTSQLSRRHRGPRILARTLATLMVLFLCTGVFGCKKIVSELLKRGNKPVAGKKCSGNSAICQDESTMLRCDKKKYTKMPCRGPDGCHQTGSIVKCDTEIANVGDRCYSGAKSAACSEDKSAMLECVRGTFIKKLDCFGEKACERDNHHIYCDASLADVGAVCNKFDAPACSKDKKSMLRCTGGVWKMDKACGKGCGVTHEPNHRFVVSCP